MKDDEANRNQDNPWMPTNEPYQEKAEDMKLWGVFLFGLIGATATTFAVGQLRRTVDWFYAQLYRSQSWKGGTGRSFRSAFQEEAWKRHNKRIQEEYEEEMERVERIRRMQSVFNRERNKYKRRYESWGESDPGAYHQHFQRDDWYWKAHASFRDGRTNYRETPRESGNYSLSHHYSVLGLDRFRTSPYTDAEIKTAFRTKAKEYHPDQNQDNREAAEAKFKEVMSSYEAIKQERKNQNL
ncbi:dnaJ-like protein subfamily C member 7-like protein [Senna tora]|uniref:DnaJ-like protein subfamily C member 7-like protein n=1 Tax=Senna tora TaxID=362788 RepID=A0A834TAJ6_9FABA|nr:dnaJ-like protein subfamily C member 7-like protein [Senna tora]